MQRFHIATLLQNSTIHNNKLRQKEILKLLKFERPFWRTFSLKHIVQLWKQRFDFVFLSYLPNQPTDHRTHGLHQPVGKFRRVWANLTSLNWRKGLSFMFNNNHKKNLWSLFTTGLPDSGYEANARWHDAFTHPVPRNSWYTLYRPRSKNGRVDRGAMEPIHSFWIREPWIGNPAP